MYEMIVGEHRVAPSSVVPTDAEKIILFDGFIAFSGRYLVDGSRLRYEVDASWNQSWTGSTQTRQFRIEENNLYVELPPTRNREGKLTTPTLIWTRKL